MGPLVEAVLEIDSNIVLLSFIASVAIFASFSGTRDCAVVFACVQIGCAHCVIVFVHVMYSGRALL